MQLHLLRHAEAEPDASSDSGRRLTPKGVLQSERVGKFCRGQGIAPGLILSSPLKRAIQTAEIVHGCLDKAELVVSRALACGAAPEDIAAELGAYTKFRSIFLVGHEPDFSTFAGWLLGLKNPDAIRLRKASLTLIETDAPRAGSGTLQFLLPARFAG